MRRPTLTRIVTMGVVCASCALHAQNQQSIGSVGIADATVSGALEVSNGRAQLLGASTVTARDHTADVALNRGGSVRVCATSGLHLNAGKGSIDAPLMIALDRGAIELAIRATANDVVMTPDLRFTLKSPGSLDLRLRVARNGDTCVENRGAAAPVAQRRRPVRRIKLRASPRPARPLRTRQPQRGRRQRARALRLPARTRRLCRRRWHHRGNTGRSGNHRRDRAFQSGCRTTSIPCGGKRRPCSCKRASSSSSRRSAHTGLDHDELWNRRRERRHRQRHRNARNLSRPHPRKEHRNAFERCRKRTQRRARNTNPDGAR